MYVKTKENKYHVGFELDRSRARAVTRCKIHLLTGTFGDPIVVGRGRTLQGEKDEFNSVTGCRFALKRALTNYGFQKSTRTLFWKEFNRCHRLRPDIVTCREAFANVDNRVCPHKIKVKGGGRDWCTEHKATVSCTSCKPVLGYSYPHSGFHVGITLMDRTVMDWEVEKKKTHSGFHNGSTVFLRKLHGLGWKKIIDDRTGEMFWPRSQATKMRQLYKMYHGDYSTLEHRVLRQQAEDRCHRVGQQILPTHKVVIMNTVNSHAERLKQLFIIDENKAKIKDILEENRKKEMSWRQGTKLTARMSMSLIAAKEFKKLDAELLRRPGITKVFDEYIIDPDKFVPAFEVGEVVTYTGDKARVYRVDGPLVTITYGKKVREVFDHELELRPHWLRRVWKWLSTFETDDFPGDESLRALYCSGCGKLGCVCGD